MRIARYGKTRYWAVIDAESTLVCLCVYRKGAEEVVQRLAGQARYQQASCVSSVSEGYTGEKA